jgi:hypothetical protein
MKNLVTLLAIMMTAKSFAMDIACTVSYEKEGQESSIYKEFKVVPGSNIGKDTKVFASNKEMTDLSDLSQLMDDTGKLKEIKKYQYVFLISGSNDFKNRDMISISVGRAKETFTPVSIGEIITIGDTSNKVRINYKGVAFGWNHVGLLVIEEDINMVCGIKDLIL